MKKFDNSNSPEFLLNYIKKYRNWKIAMNKQKIWQKREFWMQQ